MKKITLTEEELRLLIIAVREQCAREADHLREKGKDPKDSKKIQTLNCIRRKAYEAYTE